MVGIAALTLAGCGRTPERPAAKGPAKAAVPAARATPAQLARERFAQQHYGTVVSTLGADRSAEALGLCLEMLALEPQHIIARNSAVELLEQWPDEHPRIAAALTAHTERAFWGKELESIARVIAKWGQPDQALVYARYFSRQRDFGLMKAAASGMEKLLSPPTVAVLLETLPATPPATNLRAEFEHARLTLSLLGHAPAPASGLPKLIPYLKAGSTHMTAAAAIAIGRIGSEESVTTLEALTGDQRNPTLARQCVEGLWHAPHPRARQRVAAAVDGKDLAAALAASDALLATATPADANLFAKGIGSPQPHLRQRYVMGLSRLGTGANGVLASAAQAALAAGRPRTALLIAFTISDAALTDRAKEALGALGAARPSGADLGLWLGKSKEEIETVFPGLVAGQESRNAVAGDVLLTTYGPHFLRTPGDTLRIYRNQGQKIVRITVHKSYPDPVAGVLLGDTADFVWELHGACNEKIPSWLDYELDSGERKVRFTYHLDAKGMVREIDVREPEKKRSG